MAQETPRLTQEQINELDKISESGDRTGVYIKYYEFTGSDQALEQAKISSFSGWLGGIAKHANRLLQKEVPNYPIGGVEKFSEDVQKFVLAAIKKNYEDGKGGYITDLEMVQAAQRAWLKNELPHHFPGNAEVALETLWQDISKTFSSEVWKNIENEGTKFGFRGAYEHTIDSIGNIFKENQSRQFAISNQHQKHVTTDFKLFYYTDKANGKCVYVEETGAQSISGGFVQVTGISAEQVALRFNVPVEWVSENSYLDIEAIRHGASKTFIITQPRVEDGWDWGRGLFDVYNDISRMFSNINTEIPKNQKNEPFGSTKFKVGKDSVYEIKTGDTLWDIAQSYGTTVETILLLPGNEKYLERTKLGKNGEVQHVLIKVGEELVLPKPNSKLYPGDFKEKLQEVFGKDSETKLKGVEVKTNKDGRVVTEFFCNLWLLIKRNKKFNIKAIERKNY